ncbi:hypothetical protein TNCT_724581, partial [Trichonephila clavata]
VNYNHAPVGIYGSPGAVNVAPPSKASPMFQAFSPCLSSTNVRRLTVMLLKVWILADTR